MNAKTLVRIQAEHPLFWETYMERGDRIEKRGLCHLGTVLDVKLDWVSVRWDDGLMVGERPRLCLMRELRKLS